MSKLALHGGKRVRTEPPSVWPIWDELEAEAAARVARSGKWQYGIGTEGTELEAQFAEWIGAKHSISTINGTETMTIALKASFASTARGRISATLPSPRVRRPPAASIGVKKAAPTREHSAMRLPQKLIVAMQLHAAMNARSSTGCGARIPTELTEPGWAPGRSVNR